MAAMEAFTEVFSFAIVRTAYRFAVDNALVGTRLIVTEHPVVVTARAALDAGIVIPDSFVRHSQFASFIATT
jgi:hypothetical protein